MIARLDHIGIIVKDAKRSLDFYTRVLGLEGELRGNNASIKVGDSSFILFQDSTGTAAPGKRDLDLARNPLGFDHLALEVEDVERAGRELEAKGVKFLGPIVSSARGGVRYRGFADPDGNVLYVIQVPR